MKKNESIDDHHKNTNSWNVKGRDEWVTEHKNGQWFNWLQFYSSGHKSKPMSESMAFTDVLRLLLYHCL